MRQLLGMSSTGAELGSLQPRIMHTRLHQPLAHLVWEFHHFKCGTNPSMMELQRSQGHVTKGLKFKQNCCHAPLSHNATIPAPGLALNWEHMWQVINAQVVC